jgi:hypothetical protein
MRYDNDLCLNFFLFFLKIGFALGILLPYRMCARYYYTPYAHEDRGKFLLVESIPGKMRPLLRIGTLELARTYETHVEMHASEQAARDTCMPLKEHG